MGQELDHVEILQGLFPHLGKREVGMCHGVRGQAVILYSTLIEMKEISLLVYLFPCLSHTLSLCL